MLFLVQDGITNGAIYALLGLALVLVFAVTRVILIPQGEFVTYGALTYASLSSGQMPGTARLAVAMGVVAFGLDLFAGRRSLNPRLIARAGAVNVILPLIILGLTSWLASRQTPIAINIALSLLIVAAIGLFLYRIAFQPIAHTSVLVLLIASVGCHLALQGLGLVFFGAEGLRGPTISDAAFTVGPLRFSGQSLAVYAITIAFIVGLWLFFGLTLYGKALRATAVNRLGARLVGIRTTLSGHRFPSGLRDRGDFGNPDRADHDAVLRHRIPDRPERVYCRDHRRARQLSIDGGRSAGGRHGRSLFLVLCQQFQGGHRLHADYSGAAAAVAGGARGRGREGLTAMTQRLPIIVFALVMAAIPFIPGMPPFWIVLLDNIGLSALVAMGLVLLTGVGGLTSFGQAAFCGFGAYTTAVLTTAYGVSPWLTLPASLLVSGIAAVVLGLVTVRLSGHYLPLGTIALGLGLFYLFSKLEFLGRNDGISGIPPLSIGSLYVICS